jgi:hypothetical protein
MAEKKKKHAGHGYKRTTIEHHDDGSHTTHHEHEDGPHMDKKYASEDHDGMIDGLMDHTSAPNPGEAEAEAGPAPQGGPQPSQIPIPGPAVA